MSSADFSRLLFQPEKRYTGAFLQQGRVLTDEDLNAHRRLDGEDERLTFRDIICAKGSPNAGFCIDNLATPIVAGESLYDFTAAAGSYYLGGLRFAVLEGQPETFLAQTDWLQIDEDMTALPHVPDVADLVDANGNPVDQYDLVYIRAWEQNVSAVEDSELLERALGGPDTSVYSRRMRQLDVLTNVPGDCADAFGQLVQSLTQPQTGDTSGNAHGFDEESCQLQSKARLTVDRTGSGPSDDLCKPPITQGYLGSENQAIRIQLTATNRFIWGYDNASPLYRVQVTRADGLNQIKFLNLPRDEFAQPKAGQAVEIIRWGAILPNDEKVAELSGHLTTVETGYNPDEKTIVVSQDVPGAWVDWLDDPAHADYLNELDDTEDQKYLYLRLWTGGSGEAAEPDYLFDRNDPIELTGTGLSVQFSDFGLPNDFWVIAARPNTPDLVVPWNLLVAAEPFGPRRFFGGLALIRWRVESENVVHRLIECRTRFRPLCQVKGCCTIIVGDGHSSHGEFALIQDAIDALPPEGGEVCLLRGDYHENIRIADRTNVIVSGCGPDSRIIGASTDPVFEIVDSSKIEITHLAIVADGAIGIHAHVTTVEAAEQLAFNRLTIDSRDRTSVRVESGRGVALRDCGIQIQPLSQPLGAGTPIAPEPAVYIQGDELRIEENRILADEADAANRGFGGMQIGGDSQDVEIRRNIISRGNNHGLTLGHVVTRVIDPETGEISFPQTPGFVIIVDEEGCIRIEIIPPTDTGDNGESTVEYEAGPPLFDVRVIDNLIESMGGCGISVARFFELEDVPDFISVVGLLIAGNRIRDCMLLEVGEVPIGMRDSVGFGGVALADVDHLVVRDNAIRENGVASVDPISGLFVLHVEGAMIDRNIIFDNGRVDSEDAPLRPGRRGGIVLGLARAPVGPEIAPFSDLGSDSFRGVRQTGVPAAHIHDNIVVSPAGRALQMVALGPVSVEGNELTAKGSIFRTQAPSIPGTAGASNYQSASLLAAIAYDAFENSGNTALAFFDLMGGAAVSIVNLGFSNELYLQLLGLSGLAFIDQLPAPDPAGDTDNPRLFVGGNILFNNNQVVLDAFAPGISFTLSSVLLISLDDISMQDNQCDCDLVVDFALLNALVIGTTIRVSDNRLKQGFFNTAFSGFTRGYLNNTVDNVCTRCLYAFGERVNDKGNNILVEAFAEANPQGPFKKCSDFGTKLEVRFQQDTGIFARG